MFPMPQLTWYVSPVFSIQKPFPTSSILMIAITAKTRVFDPNKKGASVPGNETILHVSLINGVRVLLTCLFLH